MKLLRTLSLSACLLVLLAPAADAKKSRAKSKVPTITSVSPKRVAVGEKLVLRGKNFLPGRGKSRVYFLRGRGKLAWARADTATRTRLVVTVPGSIVEHLTRSGDGFTYTRFQLRVLGKKFGKPTAPRRSPLITAASLPGAGGGTGGPSNAPDGDCDQDGVVNSAEVDDDNDIVIDTTEEGTTKTDACDSDTDGDGVEDGYEWTSALDLNNNPDKVLPYPGKRPYPNPLDGKDGNTDYDGDGLTLTDEYRLWFGFGGHATPLNYSDGTQTTRVENVVDNYFDYHPDGTITAAEQNLTRWALDQNGDGRLRDDERDADRDGLGNWDESGRGRMDQDWWDGRYKETPKETRYVLTYAEVDMADPDSDGDGLRDGADDQDHDGLWNAWEVRRPEPTRAGAVPFVAAADAWWNTYVSTVWSGTNPWARTQPFNPCKPIWSETCHSHPPFDYYEKTEDWASPCQPDELGFPSPSGPPPTGPPTLQSVAPELPSIAPASFSC
jgi:hypothetical protein